MLSGAPERHRQRGDLTGLAGGRAQLEHREQVEAELVGELGRAGAEQHRALVVGREDRQGHDLDPDDAVRPQVAERELRW